MVWELAVSMHCVKSSAFNEAPRRGGDCGAQGVSSHFFAAAGDISDAKKPLIERLESMQVMR